LVDEILHVPGHTAWSRGSQQNTLSLLPGRH
jgi:hypothetical protein